MREIERILSQSIYQITNKLISRYGKFNFNKPALLFGAGRMADQYLAYCRATKLDIIAVADNDTSKIGHIFGSKFIVLPVKKLMSFSRDTQIIITSIYDSEIRKQLKCLGFTKIWSHTYFSTVFPDKFNNPYWQNSVREIMGSKKMIRTVFDLLSDQESKRTLMNLMKYRLFLDSRYIQRVRRPDSSEYFEKGIIYLNDTEAFVDGGAYDGDTIRKFIKYTGNKFSKIYAFEPDPLLFTKLCTYSNVLKDKRIRVYKLGLGKVKKKLHFTGDATLGSRISKTGSNMIKLVSLDKLIAGDTVSFMKFDIEGSELEALLGAKDTIVKNRPKLAICLYHRTSDVWRIPLLLKKLVPTYSLYLRHYSHFLYDTICYAV